MREEEKLAHDVYVTLYEQWGLRVFGNISRSEQQHTEAVAYLLDRYDISDPAAGNDFGEFTDADLQALYDQLVAQGSKSVADALKVGAAIEEIDILDLQERLAETDNAAIERVYNSLLAGSENHLRAFVGNLKARSRRDLCAAIPEPGGLQCHRHRIRQPGWRQWRPSRWAGRPQVTAIKPTHS